MSMAVLPCITDVLLGATRNDCGSAPFNNINMLFYRFIIETNGKRDGVREGGKEGWSEGRREGVRDGGREGEGGRE